MSENKRLEEIRLKRIDFILNKTADIVVKNTDTILNHYVLKFSEKNSRHAIFETLVGNMTSDIVKMLDIFGMNDYEEDELLLNVGQNCYSNDKMPSINIVADEDELRMIPNVILFKKLDDHELALESNVNAVGVFNAMFEENLDKATKNDLDRILKTISVTGTLQENGIDDFKIDFENKNIILGVYPVIHAKRVRFDEDDIEELRVNIDITYVLNSDFTMFKHVIFE